ncbi:MAG: protecting protein DprA [Parcubacteria group bacterium]|nr:protecting protein DprA [Parcubacteria group bacterium]
MSEIRDLRPDEYPPLLREIPEPPERLRLWGSPPDLDNKFLAIVGARKFSHYGREATESLIAGLAGYPITVVSGLALGIDAIAHRAALRAGLQTISFPGSGLDRSVLHPHSHVNLAEEIIDNGGGILSEYDDLMPAGTWTFPKRNRIMAGLSHATIVIEAEKRSGTLITSRLATEYNRDVGAVPGPISSPTSDGPHMLMRLGAAVIRDSQDILELLGLKSGDTPLLFDTDDLTPEEKALIKILEHPCERDELVRKSKLDISTANSVLMLMEIKGLIKEELGEVRKTF